MAMKFSGKLYWQIHGFGIRGAYVDVEDFGRYSWKMRKAGSGTCPLTLTTTESTRSIAVVHSEKQADETVKADIVLRILRLVFDGVSLLMPLRYRGAVLVGQSAR